MQGMSEIMPYRHSSRGLESGAPSQLTFSKDGFELFLGEERFIVEVGVREAAAVVGMGVGPGPAARAVPAVVPIASVRLFGLCGSDGMNCGGHRRCRQRQRQDGTLCYRGLVPKCGLVGVRHNGGSTGRHSLLKVLEVLCCHIVYKEQGNDISELELVGGVMFAFAAHVPTF